MKTILLFAILAESYIANAQWISQNPLPQEKKLSSVYFTNANTGYTVGDSGVILKTIDAGTSWSALSSGTTNYLGSICFTNLNTGYAVGGTILKTSDGGSSWSDISGGMSLSLTSVCFPDANTGYAGGGSWDFIKTTDAGASWTYLGPADYENGNLSSVYFTNTNIGYRTSGYVNAGTIDKTTDGGLTWFNLLYINVRELFSVYFVDSDIGYAVGGDFWTERNSVILKTTNGGADWTTQTLTNSHILRSVFFADANTGYAVGDSGTILKTSNSGADWTIQNSGTSHNLTSVFFTEANTGYVVGDFGTILKTTNGGGPLGVNNQTQIINSLSLYPNPVKNVLIINLPTKNGILDAFDDTGKSVLHREIPENNSTIDVSGLNTGMYLVKVSADNRIFTGKFLKQ